MPRSWRRKVAELDGYTAEARAGELLLGVEIEQRLHDGPMSAMSRPATSCACCWRQALFADPDILLLDEPTNHLDINTIRWLEGVLNARSSHDGDHLARPALPEPASARTWRISITGHLSVYPGSYDDYMIASTQARERLLSQNSKAKDRIAELEEFVRRFRANKSKARQATSRAKAIEKIKIEDVKPSSRQNPYIRFGGRSEGQAAPDRGRDRPGRQGLRSAAVFGLVPAARGGEAPGDHRRQRLRQDDAAANAPRRARAGPGNGQVGGKGRHRLLPAGPVVRYSKATSKSSTG